MAEARSATNGDGQQCAELCRQAIEGLQAVRGGPLYTRRETGLLAKALMRPGGLARLMSDPRRKMLVGTLEGEVVGFAAGRVEEVGEARLGVVDACYVEPRKRRMGVGRVMLQELVDWFERSRCRGIDATALPGDRATKSFYECCGFKARLLTLHHGKGPS